MQIVLQRGDLTDQRVDAIVNPTDSRLTGGGGVDAVIHQRGGPALHADCGALLAGRYRDGLPVGQAVATTGGDLPARWVIHTVGPAYSVAEDRTASLVSCYRESLQVADALGAVTVSFPAISTGAHGWPVEDAARIAIGAVRTARTGVTEVRFVMRSVDAHLAFRANLEPTDEEIALALAAKPAIRWRELFALADRFTPQDLRVEWTGSGEPAPGVLTLHYPDYSPAVREVVRMLSELDVVVPFNWSAWHTSSPLFPEATGLAEAPVADAARLATTYIRGERFSDGAIEQALQNGALLAILARLRRWFETEHPDR
ncbi:O-acetyl-ADP-ribose deacetylase [Dactylosporangium cerinum]|uniref:O-acetyl-ADP-ribose deacetylase n=1 Tax=Dactylosporangium cerinum TaxID=1434730 RepID=A0ABV9W0Q6_9ACTN